jgi:hypothetical protein
MLGAQKKPAFLPANRRIEKHPTLRHRSVEDYLNCHART